LVTTCVLDCSVVMAWAFEDESSALADRSLAIAAAGSAVVPGIWPFEVANALLVAQRRSLLSLAEAVRLLGLIDALDVEIDRSGATSSPAVAERVGREAGVSAYDAAYLELALRLAAPLATNDLALAAAAQKLGVATLAES
jgi:predicted nucleic acid-binding protein